VTRCRKQAGATLERKRERALRPTSPGPVSIAPRCSHRLGSRGPRNGGTRDEAGSYVGCFKRTTRPQLKHRSPIKTASQTASPARPDIEPSPPVRPARQPAPERLSTIPDRDRPPAHRHGKDASTAATAAPTSPPASNSSSMTSRRRGLHHTQFHSCSVRFRSFGAISGSRTRSASSSSDAGSTRTNLDH
jgi:hypothetical protein